MGKVGNTRVTGKEQYYTPPSLAESLIADVINVIKDKSGTYFLDKDPIWIEPAGGTGNFVRAVASLGYEVWSCDIEPKGLGIQRFDFLELNLHGLRKNPHVVVYGNPPFGRNNALSVKFFNHAAGAAEYIAFLVPRSWRKWSVQDKLDPRFHLVFDRDITEHFVSEEGKEIDGMGIRTCFQIWKKSTSLRKPVEVEDRGYIEKTTPEEADASITIFGRGCGTVKTDFTRVPNTTQMFVKAEPYVIKALSNLDLSKFYNRTAYIEALSIREIMFALNEYFDQ